MIKTWSSKYFTTKKYEIRSTAIPPRLKQLDVVVNIWIKINSCWLCVQNGYWISSIFQSCLYFVYYHESNQIFHFFFNCMGIKKKISLAFYLMQCQQWKITIKGYLRGQAYEKLPIWMQAFFTICPFLLVCIWEQCCLFSEKDPPLLIYWP